MKTLFTLIALVCSAIIAVGQSQSNQKVSSLLIIGNMNAAQNNSENGLVSGKYSSDWELKGSWDQVDIFTKYCDCSDPANGFFPENILFKVTNKTDRRIYLYWNYSVAYGGTPTTASNDENLVQITLEPGQSLEGTCDNRHQNKLGVFVRYIGQEPVLSSLILKDINIFNLN